MPVNCLETIVFHTPLGWLGVATQETTVLHLKFGYRSKAGAKKAINGVVGNPTANDNNGAVSEWLEMLAARLSDYAAGYPVGFQDVGIDVEGLPLFQRRVIRLCQRIPYGRTISYGELARQAGSPAAARAVGNVMARNRVPLIVPCHRVVAAGGRWGGFSAIGGVTTKRRLLEMESANAMRPPVSTAVEAQRSAQ